ncbi:MAG: hypothetical protein HKN90_01965 [Flavobacteriaceae bacterium]|nr:hypothetical protein [Flavobacteriaceae bacterium]
MQNTERFTNKLLFFIPILGMLLFILFYIVATFKYPGGSYHSFEQSGFSWQHNFLCDLLDDQAVNGQGNPAHTLARIGLGFLCLGISILWYTIPYLFKKNNYLYAGIRLAGIGSMATVLLLAYGDHDLVVRIAGILGTLALLFTYYGLYREKHTKLLLWGIAALLLVAANFYIYETSNGRYWLPIIQKLTFLVCMGWFLALNLRLRKDMQSQVV